MGASGTDQASAGAEHERGPLPHPGLHVGEALLVCRDLHARVRLLLLDPACSLQGQQLGGIRGHGERERTLELPEVDGGRGVREVRAAFGGPSY